MRSPCPLPIDAVEAVLAPFGSSALLPAAAYLDPAVLAWEQRELYDRSWVCAGRAADLGQPGDQRAVAIGSSSVVLARGDDGELRGFANLCRHRGHELLACGSTAQRRVLQCPYHAWTFDLDGTLRHAPHVGTEIDRAALALVPVQVATWGGWVFVNLSADAPPFSDHAGALIDLLAPWEPDELVPAATHHYELAANWKLVAENYHECYHCPLIHPELCRVTHPASGDNVRDAQGAFLGGSMELMEHASTMSFSGALAGSVRPGLDERRRRQVLYLHLLPNLLISMHPDYVMTHRLEPLGPDRTHIECQWLFAPDVVAADGFEPADAVGLWDVTNRQDWAAVESVQRGIASPRYVPGVLAHNEDAVYQFLAMVANAYLGGPLVRGAIPTDYRR